MEFISKRVDDNGKEDSLLRISTQISKVCRTMTVAYVEKYMGVDKQCYLARAGNNLGFFKNNLKFLIFI